MPPIVTTLAVLVGCALVAIGVCRMIREWSDR